MLKNPMAKTYKHAQINPVRLKLFSKFPKWEVMNGSEVCWGWGKVPVEFCDMD